MSGGYFKNKFREDIGMTRRILVLWIQQQVAESLFVSNLGECEDGASI